MKKTITLILALLASAVMMAQNGTASAQLHSGNITTLVYPLGYLSFDGSTANYFIGGGDVSTLFANGLWMANSNHASVRKFGVNGNDYQPGPLPIDGSAIADEAVVAAFNRVWFVSREMIDNHLAHFRDAGYAPEEAIASWPGNGPADYASQLAPYVDCDSDGVYNPMQGDYPLIRGDECVFSIFNDAGNHGECGGQGFGVEVHCMTYAFNHPEDSYSLKNTIFVHYDLFNRSVNSYDSTYLGMWSDFDLGYAWDDYMGCDVKRGMYYAFNGKEVDGPGVGSFPGVPPAQGCIILGGPWQVADGKDNSRVDIALIESAQYPNQYAKQYLEQFRLSDGSIDTVAVNYHAHDFYALDYNTWHFSPDDYVGNQCLNGCGFGDGIVDNERMGMTSYQYYDNSTNSIYGEPNVASDYFNYLHSFWKNGNHVKYGGNGVNYGIDPQMIDAVFMFPDDSDPWHWGTNGVVPMVNPYDWNDFTAGNTPGDRRGLGASGPFTFTAGGHQQFDVAYTTAGGDSTAWSSVNVLRSCADEVRFQWQRDTTSSGRPFTYVAEPGNNGINDGIKAMSLSVWPNPTSGWLTVIMPQSGDVQLYDMMGRQLMSIQAPAGAVSLDLRVLPQGIYLLRANGHVQRIVKK